MAEPHDSTIARWNRIQTALFPWMREELDPLTEALERLIHVLDTIRLEAFVPPPPSGGRGRKPEDRRALARSFVAKAMLGLPSTIALIDRLATDQVLRRICGWEKRREVPSEATFSRAFEEFAMTELAERMHAALIARSIGTRIVGCIARDATEIDAREQPAKNDDPPPPADPPLPRGRPKKGEERPKEPTRLERQVTQDLNAMLAELPTACDVGTKKNSKGYKTSWTGYKLHIDVADGQIPVCCILTSASVHDSQAAIPLMTMTGQRITYLYDIMDAAYDAAVIATHSRACGHVPLTDRNFRADTAGKAERDAEVRRRAPIHLPDPTKLWYNFRTMVERINGRLKDEFGGRFVRVRGAIKVKSHLMFGMLALTVDQIFRISRSEPVPG